MNNFMFPLLASTAFGWCYYRLLKGTGIPVGSLIGAGAAAFVMFNPVPGKVLTGLLVFAAIGVEINFQRRKRQFGGGEMVFEGGGIRRGLSPVKAGVLLKLEPRELLLVGLVQMLQKGLVSYSVSDGGLYIRLTESMRVESEIINPAEKKRNRKLSAQRSGKLLSTDEDILLELVEQSEGEPVGSLPIQVWVDRLKTETLEDLEGFRLEKTIEYYDAYITHRLNGVAVGHFDANDYVDWMSLAYAAGELKTDPLINLVKETRPGWLAPDEDLYNWLATLKSGLTQPV